MLLINGYKYITSGTEVYPQDNAAAVSDNNSVGVLYGTSATLTVDTSDYYDGVRSLKGVATGAYGYIRLDLNVTSGKTYSFSVWAKRGIQGTTQEIRTLASAFPAGVQATISSTTWTEYTFSIVATSTGSARIHFYASFAGASGDIVYIDKISIIETA